MKDSKLKMNMKKIKSSGNYKLIFSKNNIFNLKKNLKK